MPPNQKKQQPKQVSLEASITLSQLEQQFERQEIASVLQCAGNRSKELMAISPTAFTGTTFENLDRGMMGNATWSGYRLRDVLMSRFPWLENDDDNDMSQQHEYHVHFEGVDGYRTSTPLARIMEEFNDCQLVTHMNGAPLPPDHGYPLRVFLPGLAGARSVKWVSSIKIVRHECDSCFQQVYYKDAHNRAIQEMPMQCFLTHKEQVSSSSSSSSNKDMQQWRVQGIAWGGGSGVGVGDIQLSVNDFNTWKSVPSSDWKMSDASSSSNREWSWVVFSTVVDVPQQEQEPTFTSRMVSSSRNSCGTPRDT